MKQTGNFEREKKETFFPSCHAACDYDVLARSLCGVDEWNGILVEVIGPFSGRFSHAGTLLLVLLPETLATPAVVHGAKGVVGPCPERTTSIINAGTMLGQHPAILEIVSWARDEEMAASIIPFGKQKIPKVVMPCVIGNLAVEGSGRAPGAFRRRENRGGRN